MQFNIGDQVITTRQYEEAKAGLIGKVVFVSNENGDGSLGIDFGDDNLGFTHRLNGKIKSETGYWIPASHLKLLSTSRMPNATSNVQEILLNIKRGASGKMVLDFSIPEAIEKLFLNMKHEIKTSDKWPGLEFYFMPELVKNKEYKELLHVYELFDNYGADIIDEESGRMNIAWLRTVGGKGTLEIPGKLGQEEASTLVRNATAFIRDYYNNFHRPISVKGKVCIELS